MHCRHGDSQIFTVYVHIDQHAYQSNASTYSHCYHIYSVNSGHFIHLQRNSRHSKKENRRTETTV
jgi:hypothetical protein